MQIQKPKLDTRPSWAETQKKNTKTFQNLLMSNTPWRFEEEEPVGNLETAPTENVY